MKKELLLEFINAVFEEENTNPLYNTFIQPFVDVGKTAAYGIEKLSAQVQTVLSGFLLGLPTLFQPFLEYDYENFREEERERVDEIRKKYEKTLNANLEAVQSNDAFGVAFLLAPSKVLAAQLAVKAPYMAIKALDVLTGAAAPPLARLGKTLSAPASIGFHDPGGHSAGGWASGAGGGDYGGDDGVYEAKNNKSKTISTQILSYLKTKEAQEAIAKSPVAKQMRQDGVAIIVNRVKRFLAAKDYNDLRKLAKADQGFNQIGQKLAELNKTGQIPQKDNQVVTAAMVPELKKTYKNFWISQLQNLIKSFPEAIKELQDGIKQVQSIG